jgi:hypothetical protein
VLLKIVCLLLRWLFTLAVLVVGGDEEKNAELLVLQHENALLRRNAGRIRYEPGDRAWFTVLTRFIPRRRWAEVFPVTPATLLAWHRRLAARKYDTQQTTQARPPGDGPEHRPAHRPPGPGGPALGLPPYPRRADEARCLGRGVHRLRDPALRASIPRRAGTARPRGSSCARKPPGSWRSISFTWILLR